MREAMRSRWVCLIDSVNHASNRAFERQGFAVTAPGRALEPVPR